MRRGSGFLVAAALVGQVIMIPNSLGADAAPDQAVEPLPAKEFPEPAAAAVSNAFLDQLDQRVLAPLNSRLLRPKFPPLYTGTRIMVGLVEPEYVHVVRYGLEGYQTQRFPGPTGMSRWLDVRPYGAIAIHRARGAVGYSWGQPTAYDAERAAIKSCGDAACELVITVQGGCAAVAERGIAIAAADNKALVPLEYVSAIGRNYAEVLSQFRLAYPNARDVRVMAWTCNEG